MNLPYKNFLIIISSPSGAGKSTICNMLTEHDKNIKLSISATTRKARAVEQHGREYYFLSKKDFNLMLRKDQFLENAEVFGNFYGTPKKMVDDELNRNNDVLFDIDWQGARQIVEKYNKNDVLKIFILPPSMEELEKRLRLRSLDHEDIVKKRMNKARDEISHYGEYDHIIVNSDVKTTFTEIYTLIKAKRIERRCSVKNFVKNQLLKN